MKKLAALLAYLLYLLAVIEVLCAVYSLSGLSPTHHVPPYVLPADQELTPLSQWRTSGEPWGAWHKPDSQTRHMKACFNAIYRANAFGARDKPRGLAAASHPRTVVLGDSFVEGVGVAAEQRLTDWLEAKTGREFLNFGGVDFGPLQYQILYQQLAQRFEHDAVLVFVLPDNDFSDNDPKIWSGAKRYRPVYGADGGVVYPPRPERKADADKSWLPRGFWTYFWSYGAVTDLRHVLASREARPPSPAGGFSGYRDATPEQIAHVLGSLAEIKRAAGNKAMAVVLIPRPNDVAAFAQNPHLPVAEAFQRFGWEQGVTVLDLLPVMAAAADPATLYLPCDGHWSARGHQVAAEAVWRAWVQPLLGVTGWSRSSR
jgi:lysophospholipase L1-like esterase